MQPHPPLRVHRNAALADGDAARRQRDLGIGAGTLLDRDAHHLERQPGHQSLAGLHHQRHAAHHAIAIGRAIEQAEARCARLQFLEIALHQRVAREGRGRGPVDRRPLGEAGRVRSAQLDASAAQHDRCGADRIGKIAVHAVELIEPCLDGRVIG
nr:hypothetical protein [Blastomonas sp. UPD001]